MVDIKAHEIDSMSFTDFPEDVQLCILSFLAPSEIANFACTSKRFVSLCRNDSKLWHTMCDRRWGSKTQIQKWGSGKIAYRRLYKILSEWEHLIGFWRRSGQGAIGLSSPPLIFFEWGSSFLTGYRVSPSKNGSYRVVKTPFLWMSLRSDGQILSYLDADGRGTELPDDFVSLGLFEFRDSDLISVNVCFIGKAHIVVEEHSQEIGFRRSSSSAILRGDEDEAWENIIRYETLSPGSLPDRPDLGMSYIYQFFANRTSPSAEKRRQRREKERQAKIKWDPEHFVKIVNCSPTPSRPLQGLWKGISDDTNLDFYLVAYDDIGGITCRRVGESYERFSGYSPVFWTPNTSCIESPFSPEEQYIYDSRLHLQPLAAANRFSWSADEVVTHILYINSSYDLVIADVAGTSSNPRHVEGRIWQYKDGTFGFGFLRDNYIVDLRHIAQDGKLLDEMELCSD